ncbi:hypothetical protein Tco_1542857, partial [Tanacetum coccineum]
MSMSSKYFSVSETESRKSSMFSDPEKVFFDYSLDHLDHLLRLRHLKTHNDCYHVLAVPEYSYSEAPREFWCFVRSVAVIAVAIVVIVAAVIVQSLVRLAKVRYYQSWSLKKNREQCDEQ